MNIEFHTPSAQLKSIVAGYSTLTTSSKADFDSNGTLIPDGFVELFFSKGDSIAVKMPKQKMSSHMNQGFTIGQSTGSMVFQPTGKTELFSVKFHPWAVGIFLPDKASTYSNKTVALEDFESKNLLQLQDQVLHTKTTIEAIKTIEYYVLQTLQLKNPKHALIGQSINYIFEHIQQFKVSNLSMFLGVSRQYIEREFLRHVGIPPKQFSRIVRVRSIVNHHKKQPAVSLTELAYQFGYFDQSHFIKDFQLVTNKSPKAFFRKNNFVLSNYH